MIQEKLDLIETSVDGVREAITEKGGVFEGNISTLPDAIRSIPSAADAENMLFRKSPSYRVPDGEDQLPQSFQQNNKTLLEIDLNQTQVIGRDAFNGCEKLTSVLAPSVTKIEYQAFLGGTSITSLEFPSVLEIGNYAFQNCNSMPSISVPLVTRISDFAFRYCGSLTAIELPSVTYIGTSAFIGCGKLKVINFGNTRTTVPTLNSTFAFNSVGNNGSDSTLGSYHIVVPDALFDEWITKTNWSSHTNYIVDNTIKYSDAISQGIITE